MLNYSHIVNQSDYLKHQDQRDSIYLINIVIISSIFFSLLSESVVRSVFIGYQ